MAIDLAQSSLGADPHGYRAELVELMRRAEGPLAERAASRPETAHAD
jgi:hypothetical protein